MSATSSQVVQQGDRLLLHAFGVGIVTLVHKSPKTHEFLVHVAAGDEEMYLSPQYAARCLITTQREV